jgi:two-component system, response regulator
MSTQPLLLVEDNNDDAELTAMAFGEAKITNPLIRVCTGEEALEYLRGQGCYAGRGAAELPVVVLLDIKLPGLSGLEILEAIRADARTRHVPVVVLTSSDEETDRLAAYDRRANSYVRKPTDYDQFVAAARQLVLYWTVVNEPPPRRGG